MKKQTRFILISLALTAILLLATGSAAAKETRSPFEGMYYDCSFGAWEKEWTTGDIWHVRGWYSEGIAESSEPLYNASNQSLANLNTNNLTGNGAVNGTFHKDVYGVNGGWTGTFAGHIRGGLATLRITGHGTDDLAGMKYFATFEQVTSWPSPDPCGGAVSAYEVDGVILDTNH